MCVKGGKGDGEGGGGRGEGQDKMVERLMSAVFFPVLRNMHYLNRFAKTHIICQETPYIMNCIILKEAFVREIIMYVKIFKKETS